MKKLTKFLGIVLIISLIISMGIASAFAAGIQVENVIDGEEYTAYKILNYSDNGETGDNRAVTYFLEADEYASIGSVLEAAGFNFTASSDGTRHVVSNGATLDAAAVARYLGDHVSDLGNALGKYTATGADGGAVFTDLPTGYFFVTSTAGSLCALHEDSDIATAVEKNTIPTIDKKVKIDKSEAEQSDYVDGPIDGNIGDTVNYQIVVTYGTGTDAQLTVTDTMTEGLTYTLGTLKIDGEAVSDDASNDNWTVTVEGQVITIVFAPNYVASLDKSDTTTITFDATINNKAVIHSATGNENKVELDYSNQHEEDRVYVETYDFVLNKVDGQNQYLAGAGFKLYDAAVGGNQILLSMDDTGYYVDPKGSTDLKIEAPETGANVRGFAPGTYYLEETTVPEGYNKLAAREAVTITTGATAAVTVTVTNNAGTTLPSTGGIGTTIFYVVGGVMVLAAIVLLIARKRMNRER